MWGALVSAAMLWILVAVIAKDDSLSYRQAFIVVVISGLASFLVTGALIERTDSFVLARAAGIAVALIPIYLYLMHLGYNRSTVLRVLMYFVVINVVMSFVHLMFFAI